MLYISFMYVCVDFTKINTNQSIPHLNGFLTMLNYRYIEKYPHFSLLQHFVGFPKSGIPFILDNTIVSLFPFWIHFYTEKKLQYSERIEMHGLILSG